MIDGDIEEALIVFMANGMQHWLDNEIASWDLAVTLGSVTHYIMDNEHNQGVPRKHLMHARRVRQGFREQDTQCEQRTCLQLAVRLHAVSLARQTQLLITEKEKLGLATIVNFTSHATTPQAFISAKVYVPLGKLRCKSDARAALMW